MFSSGSGFWPKVRETAAGCGEIFADRGTPAHCPLSTNGWEPGRRFDITDQTCGDGNC